MRHRGIPPSLERREFRRRAATMIVGFVALGLGLLVLVAVRTEYARRSFEKLYSADGELGKTKPDSDEERVDAFAAVQDYVLQQLGAVGTEEVAWNDTRHEGHHGYYVFEGVLGIGLAGGGEHAFTYTATVTGSVRDGWELEQIEVQRGIENEE